MFPVDRNHFTAPNPALVAVEARRAAPANTPPTALIESAANLLIEHSTENSLTGLERLARGNRQLATLASVLGSSANADYNIDHRIYESMGTQRADTLGVKSALPGVERETYANGTKQVRHRLQLQPSAEPKASLVKFWKKPEVIPARFAENRQTSEVVTHYLLSLLRSIHPSQWAQQALHRNRPFDKTAAQALLHEKIIPGTVQQQLRRLDVLGHRAEGSLENLGEFVPTTYEASHNPETLTSLVLELQNIAHTEFIRIIAYCNPELATFFHFAEQALLIRQPDETLHLQRYEYLDDAFVLMERIRDGHSSFFPTFLDGIERDYRAAEEEPAWRIAAEGGWYGPVHKGEVLTHVFWQAMEQIRTPAAVSPGQSLYPLVMYELLVDAFTASPDEASSSAFSASSALAIPREALEREQQRLDCVANNRSVREDRLRDQRRQAEQIQQAKQRLALDNEKTSAEYLIRDPLHLEMVSRYRTLTAADQATDQMLSLNTVRTGDPLKAELMSLVEQTHLRQTVSHIDHRRSLRDNRCWLRSSWLSLLSCAEPAQLAQRLREIGGPDEDGMLLHRIAERFRADPRGFMQTRNSDLLIDFEPQVWQNGAGEPAYLGDAQTLSAIFSELSLTSPTNRLNIEGWLHDLNLRLAATTRLENPRLMNQLDGLQHYPSLATSDLPIALHRVFQQPALVVEIGPVLTRTADGAPDSRLAQLRMSVPKGSSLEQTLAPLAGESELNVDDPTQLQALLREFAHLPIIWLEQEHYEVYLPHPTDPGTVDWQHFG